ncbi:MAG: hypothetical protein ABSD88_08965 [Candidatus Korobacteraceae bacterium]|jgi:hypothetical protein
MPSRELIIFVAVAVLVVGWFAVGTQFNLYRGKKTLAWLQDGLKLLGDRTSLRWLGTAAVELKIQNAKEPFRNAEVVVVLEPRDVPLLWWYYRMRGRRDLLIVRGQLRVSPGADFEAFDPSTWSARGVESKLRFRNWNQIPVAPSPLIAYAAGNPPPAASLLQALADAGCQPVRVAIRRTDPNLEIHYRLNDIRNLPARVLVEAIRQLPLSMSRAR